MRVSDQGGGKLFFLLMAGVVLIGAEGDQGCHSRAAPRITIDSSRGPIVRLGQEATLTATFTNSDNCTPRPCRVANWSVNPSTATLTRPNEANQATFVSNVPGYYTIEASVTNCCSDSYSLQVRPDDVNPIVVFVSPRTLQLESGQSHPLTATVRGLGADSQLVQWSLESGDGTLSSTSGATVTYTAPIVTRYSTASVCATSLQDREQVDCVDITIQPAASQITCASPGGTTEPAEITQSTTWTKAASPHRIRDLSVKQNAVLTIDPGAVICVEGGAVQVAIDGSTATIRAIGTAADPIAFIAKDPVVGWFGIRVFGPLMPNAPRSFFTYVRLEDTQVGIDAQANVAIDHTLVTRYHNQGIFTFGLGPLTNSTVRVYTGPLGQGTGIRVGSVIGSTGYSLSHVKVDHPGQVGIDIPLAANVAISDCEVTNSDFIGIYFQQSFGASVHNCNIYNNRHYGLLASGPQTVDARYNWWGDPEGPDGPNGNPVDGNVDFSNFLTMPATLPPFP